jgi:putative transposase
MGKAKTQSYIITRRLLTTETDALYINKKMRIVERIYNAGVKHCIFCLNAVHNDIWYQYALSMYKASKTDKDRKLWSSEIFMVAERYGLSEYAMHEYLGKGKASAYQRGIGINIVQKTGTHLYSGVKKALFGKKLHFRKYGSTISFEDKKANTGIIYHEATDSVSVMGHEVRLKPIRQSDHYLQDAMLSRIKYCRIIRIPSGIHYRYFIQFVMEGTAPKKLVVGNRKIGLDSGVSTMTAYTGKKLCFTELSPNADAFSKKILYLQRIYDHKMRANNPSCFDNKGVFIKGSKIIRTNRMRQTMMQLKTMYHKRSVYVKQSNNYDTNRLIEEGIHIITEPMDYKALQKRSKHLTRQNKPSDVTNKQGAVKTVYKYKKRKRFGRSILIHSPASFMNMLQLKALQYGGSFTYVDIKDYRASQYNHVTDTYKKHDLSERIKTVGDKVVQRDCYSAFLLYHIKDLKHPDQQECIYDFDNFINCQNALMEQHIINTNFRLHLKQAV